MFVLCSQYVLLEKAVLAPFHPAGWLVLPLEFKEWSLLALGTRPEPVSFTCRATNTGCCHVDDTGVGKRNRIDPEHCNNQSLLARDTEAGRRPSAPD